MANRFGNRFNYGKDGNPIPGVPVNADWYPDNSQTPENLMECTNLSCYECVEQIKYSKRSEPCRHICLLRKKFMTVPGELIQTTLCIKLT
ncbi:MAG: hypothetical protein WAW23_08405 [Candidatus Methanoperedens sp.]